MRKELLGTVGFMACLTLAEIPMAQAAQTQISEIFGAYDAECGSNIDCTFGLTGYTLAGTGGGYDNPALFIVNQTSSPFLNATLTLTGYQDLVAGSTATVTLPNIPANTIYEVQWGSGLNVTGDTTLFANDFDDQYGQQTSNPLCVQPYSFCTFVGNFDVKFSATDNGAPISSNFSPDNTQGGGNQQDAFVGFEGLNPAGLAETTYDDHSGSQPGVLAYIYTGTSGNQITNVPEPASLSLLGAGLGALAIARRRRKSV